jgi:hypothetical protein
MLTARKSRTERGREVELVGDSYSVRDDAAEARIIDAMRRKADGARSAQST